MRLYWHELRGLGTVLTRITCGNPGTESWQGHMKRTRVEGVVNKCIVLIFLTLIVLCVINTILSGAPPFNTKGYSTRYPPEH